MLVRQAALCLSLLVLVGCATALPDSMYEKVGEGQAAIESCVRNGHMRPEVGAQGLELMRSYVAQHTYDSARLNSEIQSRSARQQTEAQCKKHETDIWATKYRQDRNRQDTRELNEAIRAATPKQTYCNKIGNQVFCNTY